MTYYFSTDLMYSADTVFPKLESVGAYYYERIAAFTEIQQLRFEPTFCECSSDGNCSDLREDFMYVFGALCDELHTPSNYIYKDIGARAFIHSVIDNLPPVFTKWTLILTITTAIYTFYLLLFAVFVEERSQYQSDDKAIPS